MTPHDIELKRFNDIQHRLQQIEDVLFKVMDDKSFFKSDKLWQDAITLCLVYMKDVKDKFMKYSERQYDA